MELFLVQHGLATSAEENPDRPLNDDGLRQTQLMARRVRADFNLNAVWHSGKTRTRQTAEILSAVIDPSPQINEVDNLGPNDDPRLIKKKIESFEGNLLVVGHLPHLKKLAGLMLAGDESIEVVHLINSGILCLTDSLGQGWTLRWYVTPEMEQGI